MNPALVQRPGNRFQPAILRAGLGLLARAQGGSPGLRRTCACATASHHADQAPWAFRTAGSTGECTSGGRCGGDCCGGNARARSYKRAGEVRSADSHGAKAASKASPKQSAKDLPYPRESKPKPHGRRTEHPRHPTKPKSPQPKEFRDEYSPQDFRGGGCFVPAFEIPTSGPHEPEVRDLIWKDGDLVDIRDAFRDVDERQRQEIEDDPWTVRGLCVRPKGVTGPVPFVLMMHQAGGGYHRYRGYRAIQEMLASHGIASVCSSDNSKDDESFKHPGLEFSDEARRAAMCLWLAERFAAATQLTFGPRIGLLGHSRGGWAAQNLATLINWGSAKLIGLAIDPESFRNVRVEGLCLVGSSSHHAANPTCPVLLIQGSRDEDLKLDPSWWLVGRAPSGFISVAYVRDANHNWFNRTNADQLEIRGRRGPNSPPLLNGDEHVRILTGLAVSLFRLTLLGHQTSLTNGTSVLPHGARGSAYRIAFRASDCVTLLRDFGTSSLNGGRGLLMESLVRGGTHTADIEVHAAVFNGLAADTGEWPADVSVYVPPDESRPAIACCGHGLILRRLGTGRESPFGEAVGLRIPLPAEFDLHNWMVAVTAAAVDPNPIHVADADSIRPTFVGGEFYLGVESPRTGIGPVTVTWSSPRSLWPNDDLQFESAGAPLYERPGAGFPERFCVPAEPRLRHIPYFCNPLGPNHRNNGTTAYCTTYWFPAECFLVSKGSPTIRAAALWVCPGGRVQVAIQRLDLFRREELYSSGDTVRV